MKLTPMDILGEQKWKEATQKNRERFSDREEDKLINMLLKAGADLSESIHANSFGGMSICFSTIGHVGSADIRIGIDQETGEIVPETFEFNYPSQTIPREFGPETMITAVGSVKQLVPIGFHKEGVPL
tara:strand:+ start:124837 stop:125220 length:384 start_codon:yes stop_codon:yes gene_type:complete